VELEAQACEAREVAAKVAADLQAAAEAQQKVEVAAAREQEVAQRKELETSFAKKIMNRRSSKCLEMSAAEYEAKHAMGAAMLIEKTRWTVAAMRGEAEGDASFDRLCRA
jgi:hypothetical protein